LADEGGEENVENVVAVDDAGLQVEFVNDTHFC
jgi:hypothetical protein